MRATGRQRRLVILALAVIGFGIAFYSGSRYRGHNDSAPAITGVAIQPPTPLPSPEGGDDPGSPVSTTALSGHWSLVMLDPHEGQTRAPALLRLLKVHNRLAAEPTLQRRLHYLYLPQSGAKEALKEINALGDNITAFCAGAQHTEYLFRRFGADPQSDDAVLYLVGPQVKLRALFTPDEDVANIAKDLTTLINATP
jgi:hypothetical protein